MVENVRSRGALLALVHGAHLKLPNPLFFEVVVFGIIPVTVFLFLLFVSFLPSFFQYQLKWLTLTLDLRTDEQIG